MVEQIAKKGLGFANIGYVLVSGELAIAGKARELLADPDVGRLFLGGRGRGPKSQRELLKTCSCARAHYCRPRAPSVGVTTAEIESAKDQDWGRWKLSEIGPLGMKILRSGSQQRRRRVSPRC